MATENGSSSSLEVITAKNGSPTLRVADGQGNLLFLHSSYNPEAEGTKAAAGYSRPINQMVVVLGFGLGYHVQALMEKLGPEGRLFVVESRSDIFARALALRDLSWLEEQKVTIVCGEERSQAAEKFSQVFNIARDTGLMFFEHAPSVKLNPAYYEQITATLRDVVSLQLSTVATLINFKDLWIKNNLDNLMAYVQSPGVNALLEAALDMPAIIISAGPSLNKNIHQLAQAKGKALLLCVGTALRAVLKAGIKPDLVVTYDAGEANFQHFAGLDYSDMPLVFDPMVHPGIVKQHHGKKFVLSVGNDITSWIESAAGAAKGFVKAGGSVATLALALAVKMGCNPIAMVGQDLSFPGGRTHARGTVYEENRIEKSADNLHQFYVPANDGSQVLTNRGYYSFIVWFEHFIKDLPSDKLIINATEGGAKIEGTVLMRLNDYLDNYCQRDISGVLEKFHSSQPQDYPDMQRLTRQLAGVVDNLQVIRKKSAKGAALAAELYENYCKGILYNEEKIVKELNNIDRTIKTKQEEVPFINQAMQEVLISVTRGPLNMPNEKETLKEKNLRVTALSKALYEGINESVSILVEYFNNALATVRTEIK